MAELDSNIVLKAFATPQLDIAGTLQAAQDRRRQQMLQQRQDADYQRQQATLARQQQDQETARGVIRQYGKDPTAARQSAFQTGDPELIAHLNAMAKADLETQSGHLKQFTEIARSTAPLIMSLQKVPPEQVSMALQQIAPELQERGLKPEQIQGLAQQLADPAQRNTVFSKTLANAQTIEEYNKAHEAFTLNQGDRRFDGNGHMIAEGAAKPNVQIVEGPNGFYSVDKATGHASPVTVGGGQASVQALLPAIVQQESRGNYSAINRGTGAMGAYQVMPATAKVLAGRLGLPWRPELMTASTADGRQYQDAIGHAAVSEAVEASGGDPAVAAAYYHGGSDQSKWGPKTRQYAQEVTARLGRQGGTLTIKGAPKPQGSGPAPPSGKEVMALRKEFDGLPEVKTFKTVRAAMQQIQSLARNPNASATDDVALIFSYMKMLDPTSVVREGEFATAQNTAGIPDQIRNSYNRAISGNRLNQDQRINMLNSAAKVYLPIRENYNAVAQQYQGYARGSGIDPYSIAREYRHTPQGGGNKGGGKTTYSDF